MSDEVNAHGSAMTKAPTGIVGLDLALGGGLPVGRTTLLLGTPGAGKTVLSLQFLAHGAATRGEPGILVSFEEPVERLLANAAGFGWDLPALIPDRLFLLDGRPGIDEIKSGDADLRGLLAALDATVTQTGARRIVFDAIDMILNPFDDPSAERRELRRLHDWLIGRELTAVITCKAKRSGTTCERDDALEFMVDCAVSLEHRWFHGVSQRSLHVFKYRGSSFLENEAPYVIGRHGLEVATVLESGASRAPVTTERVSSGIDRLDAMLGGGYFRGASILITGTPGTAKTTLGGAFLEAACKRGERALLVSFDSDAAEIVRNLDSVGIRLEPFLADGGSGHLRIVYARAIVGSAESQLMCIKRIAAEHDARCVVVDPVSVLASQGNATTGAGVTERLVDWAKGVGVTLLCSSLIDDTAHATEHTALQISKIADTWIHLQYLVRGGERNRGISIIKSRGTAHSNQVRELLLSSTGVTLADAYSAGGEVLMGSLRAEHERAEAAAVVRDELIDHQAREKLLAAEADLAARLVELERELIGTRVQLQRHEDESVARRAESQGALTARLETRGADPTLVAQRGRDG